jgi:hypothetical protein
MRAALLALCLSLPSLAEEPVVDRLEPRPAAGWTGGGALLFGAGGPHGESVDGYFELGKRLNADLALLGHVSTELGISPSSPYDLVSGGLGLRITGDQLGGLLAPIELTLGVGVSGVVQGVTVFGGGPFAMAFFDTIFPITRRIRIHSQIVTHFNLDGSFAFITAGAGFGVTFE